MNELISQIDNLFFELNIEVPKVFGVLDKVKDITKHSTTSKYGFINRCVEDANIDKTNAQIEINVINYLLNDSVQEFVETIKPKLVELYEKFNQLSERIECKTDITIS